MNDTAVLAAFDRLRERLAVPARWTQGAEARNEAGLEVDSTDATAVAWCLGAAADCIPAVSTWTEVWGHIAKVQGQGFMWDVTKWNDAPERTHQEVLDLIDRAKALYLTEQLS